SEGETYGASVWQIPELNSQSNAPQLEHLISLNEHSFKIKCVLWWPSGKHDKLISIDEGNLFLWSIDTSNKMAKVISQESVGMLHNLSGGAWDPHDRNAVAGICDSSLEFWDLRTMKKTSSIEQAHARDVDYNPKKQHLLVTAEDVSGIRLWDLRRPKCPVKELPGHAHWTWAVRHNPEYDELILSAGTDSTVNLWLAHPPGANDSMSESPVDSPKPKDSLLNSYTDYEDSVYGLAWSTGNLRYLHHCR
ncbi:WD domain, G-beta repeat, partial [Musa troglodytarum]